MPHGPHVYDKKCNRLFSLDEWNDYISKIFPLKIFKDTRIVIYAI